VAVSLQISILAGYKVIIRDLKDGDSCQKRRDTMVNGALRASRGAVERGKVTQEQVDKALNET